MNQQVKLQSRLVALPQGVYLIRIKPGQRLDKGIKLGLYPSPLGKGRLVFINNKKPEPVAFLQQESDEVLVVVKENQATLLVVDFKHPQSKQTTLVEISVEKLEPKDGGGSKNGEKKHKKQSIRSTRGWLPLKAILVGGAEIDAPNGSIGAPGSSKEITAFAIDDNALPEGVDLVYACRKAGQQNAMFEKAGNVLGLDKQDLPITAVSFMSRTADGKDVVLTGHVAFAGQPPLAIVSGKELSGPTGREALVALRVSFANKTGVPGVTPTPSVWNDATVLKSVSS